MSGLSGGCLCGAVRFDTGAMPDWVTRCFCRFCQKVTGTAMLTEPIFPAAGFRLTQGTPQVYTHVSEGSGMDVHLHFCAACSSPLYLTFERWPDRLGVYLGALDDAEKVEITPETTKYIFTDNAPAGTLLPPGFRTYPQHAADAAGTPLEPVIFEQVHRVPG